MRVASRGPASRVEHGGQPDAARTRGATARVPSGWRRRRADPRSQLAQSNSSSAENTAAAEQPPARQVTPLGARAVARSAICYASGPRGGGSGCSVRELLLHRSARRRPRCCSERELLLVRAASGWPRCGSARGRLLGGRGVLGARAVAPRVRAASGRPQCCSARKLLLRGSARRRCCSACEAGRGVARRARGRACAAFPVSVFTSIPPS